MRCEKYISVLLNTTIYLFNNALKPVLELNVIIFYEFHTNHIKVLLID